jgi:hypothetical protein
MDLTCFASPLLSGSVAAGPKKVPRQPLRNPLLAAISKRQASYSKDGLGQHALACV